MSPSAVTMVRTNAHASTIERQNINIRQQECVNGQISFTTEHCGPLLGSRYSAAELSSNVYNEPESTVRLSVNHFFPLAYPDTTQPEISERVSSRAEVADQPRDLYKGVPLTGRGRIDTPRRALMCFLKSQEVDREIHDSKVGRHDLGHQTFGLDDSLPLPPPTPRFERLQTPDIPVLEPGLFCFCDAFKQSCSSCSKVLKNSEDK
ncbi:hypothetical protein EJ05DRAFT_483069 [Pseudovirgaria hyperparasitica]|uniref:Uncharacterized protein n=1 Tax=Pseudovirgaria hyperparasitica TaxID=470096 RepID=A0A6A6WJB8_9PEZI|nr:uncharacterized protein EJ05DRAFT_483069 [Pseudovirgaria hyperparasitica]KAF2762315.1 hypothetical protein EJ05DRAFT_483069 [Pseudovirgaria hyperparasitica]